MSTIYQKGDIVWIDLGKPPEEVKGHEQGFKRPGIVLSDFSTLKLALIAPCTSKDKKYLMPTSVVVSAGTGGLKEDSMILLHQIRTVSHERITGKIGILPESIIGKVDTALLDILDL
jgi:mRNA interferase MazF